MIPHTLPTAEQEQRWAESLTRLLSKKSPYYACWIAATTPKNKREFPWLLYPSSN